MLCDKIIPDATESVFENVASIEVLTGSSNRLHADQIVCCVYCVRYMLFVGTCRRCSMCRW